MVLNMVSPRGRLFVLFLDETGRHTRQNHSVLLAALVNNNLLSSRIFQNITGAGRFYSHVFNRESCAVR